MAMSASPPESAIMKSARRSALSAVRSKPPTTATMPVVGVGLVLTEHGEHRDLGSLGGSQRGLDRRDRLTGDGDEVGAGLDGLLHRRVRALGIGGVVRDRRQVPSDGVGRRLEAARDRQDRLDVALQPVQLLALRRRGIERDVDRDLGDRLEERLDPLGGGGRGRLALGAAGLRAALARGAGRAVAGCGGRRVGCGAAVPTPELAGSRRRRRRRRRRGRRRARRRRRWTRDACASWVLPVESIEDR